MDGELFVTKHSAVGTSGSQFSAVFNNIKVLDVQTIHWCLTTGFQNAGGPVHLRA